MKQKTAHTSEAHDGARPGLAMTESGRRKPWSRRPSWLKEVLSKSGTELVAITAASKKNASASSKSHKSEADSPSNMVYYQSMPLVVKTEQPQQQFCGPLRNGGDSVAPHPQQLPQQHFPQNCVLRSNTTPAATFLPQQPTSSSIAHAPGHTAVLSSPFAAASVKTEPQLRAGMPTTYSEPSSSFEGGAPPPAPAATPLKPAASKPKFKCAQCGMNFGSKSAHTSHTKSHAKSEGASLEDAAAGAAVDLPLGIPKKPLLKAELGSGDPYRCNVCEKTFAVPARLIRHYRTHTGERPFECEWCHKLFSVKENLQVHRRIHTKERPYQCQVCERAFEHSGKLHRHNRIHTGERPHGCSLCDKTFIQSGQLVIHMRTHTGEKPYKCPVEGCGKGFTCSKQLKVHSRTHTGEKPYRCDICQREFGYNHVLKLHRMQHYGAKCYKCTICDDTFKSKKEMEAHIKRHANDLPDDGRRDPAGASLSSSSSSSSSPGLPLSQSPAFSGQPQPQFATLGYPMKATSSKGDFTVAGDRVSPAAQSEVQSAGLAPAASPTLTMTNGYESERAVSSLLGYAMDTDAYERPTDLRVLQQQVSLSYSNSEQAFEPPVAISYSSPSSATPTSLELHHRRHMVPEQSINPALLEAASIAARMSQVNIVEEPQDAETQAALQIMQLHRSQQPQPQQEELQHVQRQHYDYDDTQEANQLIEHYKRGELATHGIHKGYAAPVPKFKSSLLNNEIIVRQVEAAIAPLRSSTESPERASSPDSDSNMLMADRDVMTLPLRKRKVYMSEGPRAKTPTASITSAVGANGTAAAAGAATTQPMGAANVIRMSTVIQFAKAS